MRWFTSFIGVLVAASQVAASPAQLKRAVPEYLSHQERVDAIREAFSRSWTGYYKYAFPHDSLEPIAKKWEDDRNGWGASAVDALSTALVLGDKQAIKDIIKFIPTIDFDHTDTEISLFETTIRYLGGMLSGYDLLTGPLKKYTCGKDSFADDILKQAERLANNLKVAFDTPTGVPDNSVFAGPYRRGNSTTNGIATIGTLVLEWTRLSDITGKSIYGELAQKGEAYLLKPKNPDVGEPFPGLIGSNVYIENGTFADGSGGWVGGDDSFYEYLIKMYLYDPERFSSYKDRWVLAADSSMKYLESHPTSEPDLTYLAIYHGTSLEFYSEHLACFDGGNFILGGLTLNEQKYIDFGLALTASCHRTYTQTATHIGPESFRWQDTKVTNATSNPPAPANQSEFYDEAGYWIESSAYILRPEVIESYYYAYRATGDRKYQDWAWVAFLAINKTCSYGVGFSGIRDVNAADGGGAYDFQESFWFAEVLKYSYLIQAPDADFQVKADHTNKFVYNTECHPVKIPGGEQIH